MPQRLYQIQGSDREFYAGIVKGRRQVLMGPQSFTELIAIFFDENGCFLNYELRPLPPEPVVVGANPYDPDLVKKIDAVLSRWHAELEFRAAPIKVRKFDCEGNRVEDLPDYLQEFEDNPEQPSGPYDPPAEELRETLRNWREKGMYVLWWGKDYWMTAEGEVDST